MAENKTSGTPATPAQVDALQTLLDSKAALALQETKLERAKKDAAFYVRKVAREEAELSIARGKFAEAEAAFRKPQAR